MEDEMTSDIQPNIYAELGISTIINAIGSVTMLGGSTLTSEVKEAMERAGDSYVPLMELEEKIGDFISEMIGVPAAYVTSGAGSALTLAAAAVMAGDDDNCIQQLPDTSGMKNEILIQKRQRYWYDRCLEVSGAKLVEFGDQTGTTKKDLLAAIGPKTAAVHFYIVEQEKDPLTLSLPEVIEISQAYDIPVLVDAAGQIYPLDNFGKYVKMGADFQCIAAKYMGAPQSTGLALGTKDMIRKISKQSFVGYEGRRIRGIGRPHKVDRQEMVGVVAAVRHWLTMNHETRLADIEQRSSRIINHLSNLKGVSASMINNIIGHQPFGVELRIDESLTKKSLEDVVDLLKSGAPPIWTRVREGEDHIQIHIFGLKEGEEEIVGERIAEIFK
jgi:L-seryl-tRNA(Ser) seleniumtransferase